MKFKYKKALITFCSIALYLILQISTPANNDDFNSGRKAFTDKNFSQAAVYFKRALESNPRNLTVRYFLGQSYYKNRQYGKAQVEFSRIYKMSPNSQVGQYSKTALNQISSIIGSTKDSSDSRKNISSVSNTRSNSNRNSNDKSSYIKQATADGQIMRWQTTNMPLKVYIANKAPRVNNFSPAYVNYVKSGIEKWANASGGIIFYKYVNSPNIADVRITWTVDFIDPELAFKQKISPLGVSSPEQRGSELNFMNIKLVTTHPHGKALTPTEISDVACHEMGHSLGILGHSEDSKDMMYWASSGVHQLTQRDINTLKQLYSIPPTVSNFKSSRKNEKIASGNRENNNLLGSTEEQKKIELAEAMEKINRNDKSDTAYFERGTLYLQKGNVNKAIEEYKECISINPRNEEAYFNLAIAYHKCKKFNDAIDCYRKARQINPDNTETTLRIANLYYMVNKKSEASFELNKYLVKNPKARNDKNIQLLKRAIESR